ncbi:MAG: hypothetical protein ACRCXZ_03010 [Patescibacteria group bacterium]
MKLFKNLNPFKIRFYRSNPKRNYKFKANKDTGNVRVFAPSPNVLESENIQKSYSFPNFKENIFANLTFNKLNKLLISSFIFVFLLCFFYLIMVDRFFLIKNINVVFKKGSYLSREDAIKIKENLESAHLSVFAKNNILFQSSSTLTSGAREVNPNVLNVELNQRILPNTIDVTITTEPILATLQLNSDEKWRVAKSGRLVTKDDLNLNEKLIIVQSPVMWNTELFNISSLNITNLDGQLDRLYFIEFVRENIENLGYKITKSEVDTIESSLVLVQINKDTILKFDSKKFSVDNIASKLVNILRNKKIAEQINSNQIRYIDFRVSDNVFICLKQSSCENI